MGTNKRGIINFMELQKYISQEYGLIRGIEINGISYLVGKDIAEKLDYLMNHPNVREKMGKESRRLYEENFTEEKMIEKLAKVFNTVLHM